MYVGDAAQIGSIGAGGLFAQLEGKVATAELTDVHRAHYEWERQAWEQIRNGEPGPALAQYQGPRPPAHPRHPSGSGRGDGRELGPDAQQPARRTRRHVHRREQPRAGPDERDGPGTPGRGGRAWRTQGAAAGQALRAGSWRRGHLLGPVPHPRREADRERDQWDNHRYQQDKDKVTIKTHEREPREVQVNTSEFSDLSLSYAAHVHKGQGITAETSGILIGGWQTDKEHAYVAVSRAREQTQIYVSREDLGEQGFDTGAMERLADRMQHSRAQEATIAKNLAERDRAETPDRSARIEDPTAEQSPELSSPSTATQATGSEIDKVLQARQGRQLEWQSAIDVDRSGDVNEQAEEVQAIEDLAELMRNQGASEETITKEIAELTAGSEHDLQPHTRALDEHARYIDQVLEQQRQRLLDEDQQHIHAQEPDREPHIEQAIQEERDRQQELERGVEQEPDNDLGFGME